MGTRIIPEYGKIDTVGHRRLKELFDGLVYVEEKVDGSNFSFAKIDSVLYARSKKQMLDMDNPVGMFNLACQTVRALEPLLHDGWIYRAEYLAKPKHNTLTYPRVPVMNLVIFDIETHVFGQHFLNPVEKAEEAARLGLECVPLVGVLEGSPPSAQWLYEQLLGKQSFLGEVEAEGVVLKNYEKFDSDSKILIAKIVRDDFKEKNGANWTRNNPAPRDIVTDLSHQLRSEARWRKAVQHVRESGRLTDTPKDIGLLVPEMLEDIKAEETEYIKNQLFTWAWKTISREVVKGFPDWYKQQLLESVLEEAQEEKEVDK